MRRVGEFEPGSGSEDDEETIARAERDLQQHDTTAEVSALQKESEMSLDDVLDQLPPGYLENRHRDVPDADKVRLSCWMEWTSLV